MKQLFTYLERHAQAGLGSLGALARAPFASLMTVAVIGITLALPAAMFVAVDNAMMLSRGWDGPGRISLFLKPGVDEARAQKLAQRLQARAGIARIETISRDQAFEEFKRDSGFGDTLDALDHNPLPVVVLVHPAADAGTASALEQLAMELRALDEVDIAQLDLDWVQRLQAWLGLVQHGIGILGGLLALAVLLIVGNTIRLAVLSRRDEIEVAKLVGATDAFIRRPFLYSGTAQGLLGGMLAWVLVQASLWMLAGPIGELVSLYGSNFRPAGLSLNASLTLLATGAGLGWVGARLAVGRHLRVIEPK